MSRLRGKRAVITGGGRGLGAAAARRFVAEGASIVLVDLPQMADRAGVIVAESVQAGSRAGFIAGDVLDAESIRGAIDRAADSMGGIDLCIPSAGVAAHPDAGFRG